MNQYCEIVRSLAVVPRLYIAPKTERLVWTDRTLIGWKSYSPRGQFAEREECIFARTDGDLNQHVRFDRKMSTVNNSASVVQISHNTHE